MQFQDGIPLDSEDLQRRCHSAQLPWRVTVLDEVGSTNDWLRAEATNRTIEGDVVFAEVQTAGRGRRDHQWLSESKRDLIFTLAICPTIPLAKWTRFTQLAALAICEAIESVLPTKLQIKWPNDLMIDGKKVGGLLLETFSGRESSTLLLGVGLNVNGTSLPGELAQTGTTLRRETPGAAARELGLNRQILASEILTQLHHLLPTAADDVMFSHQMEKIRSRSWLIGKRVTLTLQGDLCRGLVEGLDSEGRFLLRKTDGGLQVIESAENVRVKD